MLTFLFWNLNRLDLMDHVAALVEEHAVDVLVLAESPLDHRELRARLKAAGADLALPHQPTDRCKVAVRRGVCDLKRLDGTSRYSWYRVDAGGWPRLTLFALHAPGRPHYKEVDHLSFAAELASTVRRTEDRARHRNTVLVGDFNMNPFETAMISAAGLHAVGVRDVAAEGRRTVNGVVREMFFNPMWAPMGQPSPPGSYFHRGAAPVEYFWHTLDQVLLRPPLLTYWSDDAVRFLTRSSRGDLVDGRGRPRASDHLPLLFHLLRSP